MWRSNDHEDWERRKTYLIRSLFQDIPVLSPVREDQEYGSGSPSDIPAYRPHSPLPPLIIERMPNRHDHPEKFYNDLEKKMKKLYKKLFLNKESSSDSVEDLIEIYGVDLSASNLTNELQENFCDIDGGNESVSTLFLGENRSQCHSSSLQASLIQRNTDRNINKSLSVDSSDVVLSNSPEGSTDIQSSTHSLGQTQVTTVVEIHQEHSPSNVHLSPVLKCQNICFDKPLVHVETCKEEGYVEKADDSIDETGGTETSGSAKEGDSKEDDLEMSSSELMTHPSIEIMRKQKESSPSLGSLQNDPFASPSSKCSSIRTNLELHKKISLDLPDENVSSGSQRNITDTSFSSVSVDFSNVLTTLTPKINERSKLRCSSKSNETGKRLRSQYTDEYEEDNSIVMTKRRKCENIAIQTSLISESDTENVFDWNQMKTNFFVGIPRIYKLCACNDHACGNI